MAETKLLSLWGDCGEFAIPARAWLNMLTLARWYGWKPEGTKPPKAWVIADGSTDWKGLPEDWDGRYFPGDLQRITERDAKALAAALTRALADIPEHDALEAKALAAIPADQNDYSVWGRKVRAGEVVNPFEEFSGLNKPMLRDFMTHCREKGGLWIG